MKKLFTIICAVLITLAVNAQESSVPETVSDYTKIGKLLSNVSFVGSLGSPNLDLNANEYSLENASGTFSLGELGVAYKLNGRVRVGVSILGALGNCNSGYLDQEGNFVGFYADNEEEEEDDDEQAGEHEDNNNCDMEAIDNISGTVTVQLFGNVPLYLQATGGYSASADAAAISAMIAYNQKIFSELGAYFGVRFSDVFHDIPKDAVSVTSSSGLKAELGLTWNF